MARHTPTSFINEHTAEFFLVPAVMDLLARSGRHDAIPMTYWGNREGSRVSINSGFDEQVRAIAIFPRRPKVREAGDELVYIKLNYELFKTAQESHSLGIPVFAGGPVANSIFQLNATVPHIWFYIDPTIQADDILYQIEADTQSIRGCTTRHSLVVQEGSFVTEILQRSLVMSWGECVEKLREMRSRTLRGPFMASRFGGNYRPIFFIVKEPQS